ncbi:MAG TPA: glycoside hydrolase family 27 protein [Gemmatimonadaceae bacterium]|nr:glycoside hydrolase family 27 protein [Gemmatimonadaceae bacterium]
MRKLVFLLWATTLQAQKTERLALTPPMGWNSWNKFHCDINESLIRETADAMASNGMKAAGYQYVNIDDCWHGARDSLGFIRPDPDRFPSGMKALADYVHSKGLKLGIYSDAGSKTCAKRPGSRGYENQDAETYARWGIDYLKYDWCNTDSLNAVGAYMTMHDALLRTGRPIVFSICEWGSNKPWLWAPAVGNLWRTTEDIHACFDCLLEHDTDRGVWVQWGVMPIMERQALLRGYAGPGHWNDPDMLEVGNGMTVSEDRAHFTMWAMLAAPLISGNDLRHMSPETAAILTNRGAIAVDQDSLGVEGLHYRTTDSVEVWFKPLSHDGWAMVLLNRARSPRTPTFDWRHEAVSDSVSGRSARFADVTYHIRDVWGDADRGTTAQAFSATVQPHGVVLLLLTR